MPTEAPTDRPVITVTDVARATIIGLRRAEPDPDGLALRLDVVGDDGTEFAYELTFEPLAEAADDDVLFHSEGLPVLVPASAIDSLKGATLDESDPTGLVLRNPNRPEPREKANPWPEGSVAAKVQELLDGEINPALASHGGFASLERVEGSTAYLLMGGGCQGCGLAQMTLTEGIKAAIEEAIPEIDRVVDVTDHAAGENPFFAPA
jgi:Fe/S biogenesis protein NfuA